MVSLIYSLIFVLKFILTLFVFLFLDETSLELRDLVQFKNGATYEGQWLGNMKHGHGT